MGDATFRLLIEESQEGVIVVRDGAVVYANRASARTLGQADTNAVVGRPLDAFVHPDDHAVIVERMAHIQRIERVPAVGVEQLEVRMRDTGGGERSLELSASRVDDFAGAPAVLVFARETSERRRREQLVILSERMASVGALGAAVAHEINNPLAATFANVAWLGGQLDELRAVIDGGSAEALRALVVERIDDLDEAVQDAALGAERVRGIVKDLRVFTHGEGTWSGPVDIARVLDSSLRVAKNEIIQRARLTKDYDGTLPAVEANEPRLAQVFLNLLVNAAHAIPEGRAAEHEITVRARAEAERVVVEVADTGMGMAPEIARRIFEPFFTTKPIGVGTGLGLAICHRILTSLGGTIDVETELGRGTTFRVTLPRSEERPVVREVETAPPARRRGRILFIDDDPLVAATVRRLLSKEHDTRIAVNGRVALDLILGGATYDVIFCDLMMPEMNGMDFHDALARLDPARAREIIFVTGGAFTPRARDFLERVPNVRCDKPFDAAKIRALIAERVR